MRNAARVLSIGIMLGAFCAVGFQIREAAAQPANAAVIDALAAEPIGTTQRAAFYAEVARADVRSVKALLDRAAELKDPATKSFALDVLLTRFAELDPGGAVAAASKLGPSAPNPVPLYQAWLRSSPAAALAAIGKLDESQASMIVPGLLARVESDQELVNEILAAAPRPVADRYVASSLLRLAQDSPREALERAQEIARSRRACGCRQWRVTNVGRRAIRASSSITSRRSTSRRDATPSTPGSLYQIASSEPELALDRADLFPPELRSSIALSAIPAIAQRDPLAAYARAQQMPLGQERRR